MQQLEGEPLDGFDTKNEKLELCVEKVGLMSKLIYKAAYSRPMQYKRHLFNQHKLNEFLGRNLLAEKDEDAESANYSLSNESHFNRMAQNNKRVTYAELLERIAAAEKHYEHARGNQVNGKTGKSDLQSSLSNQRPALGMSQSNAFML